MIDSLIRILAPHHCHNCSILGDILCDCCKNYILDEPFSGCVICGLASVSDNICEKHQLPYQRLWCVARREGALGHIIDDFKFRRLREAHKALAELIDRRLPNLPQDVVVVAVPTAPKNIRIRGYDHMKLVAKALAKRRGWQLIEPIRRKSNQTQHFAKSAKQRRSQAKEFFEVRRQVNPEPTYLLIDDIFTTGATLKAATDCLKQAGAETIWTAVIARQ